MFPEFTREELASGMDTVVRQVLDRAGVQEPPVDAFEVARALRITVAVDDLQQGRARYVQLSAGRPLRPQTTILLRSDPRWERRQWAVAHEIGEHVAHRLFGLLGIDPRTTAVNAREVVANHLAGRLLLPTEWFVAEAAECDWDLLELKDRFATASHELIARRMLECPPPVIVSIFDQGKSYFRRSNVPGRVPPLSTVERQCWEAAHSLGLAQRAQDGTSTVHAWPVHEEGWKREIVRTEVDEWA